MASKFPPYPYTALGLVVLVRVSGASFEHMCICSQLVVCKDFLSASFHFQYCLILDSPLPILNPDQHLQQVKLDFIA